MAKFKVIKEIKLDFLGSDWKDCYVKFVAPNFVDIEEMTKKVDIEDKSKGVKNAIEWLKSIFIDGKGIDMDGKLVEITKDDLADLPVEIITKVFVSLKGEVDPNL